MLYIETEANGTRYFHGLTYNNTRGSFRCFRTLLSEGIKTDYFKQVRHFRTEKEAKPSKLSQRILGLLLGVGKKWPIADRRVPRNYPRSPCEI